MFWLRKVVAPAIVLIGINAVSAGAQTSSDTTVFYFSPDEYEITVPTTCPSFLRGGFTGFWYGYEHEGYVWPAGWMRTRFVTATSDVADYVPDDGSRDMVSRDGRATWYNAGVRVRCTATRQYFLGRMITSTESYRVITNFGTVVPKTGGETCGGEDFMTSVGDSVLINESDGAEPTYIPPGCGDVGSGGDPGEGNEGGDDSGDEDSGDTATFAARCGALGGRLYYDIIDLVEWNEKTGAYDTVWTGVAAICET